MKLLLILHALLIFHLASAQEPKKGPDLFGTPESYEKAAKQLREQTRKQKEENDKACPPPNYRVEIKPYTPYEPGKKREIKCHRINDVDRFCSKEEANKAPSRCLSAINRSGCHSQFEKRELRRQLIFDNRRITATEPDYRIMERWEVEAEKVRPEPCPS